jgi:hypothetical protein
VLTDELMQEEAKNAPIIRQNYIKKEQIENPKG